MSKEFANFNIGLKAILFNQHNEVLVLSIQKDNKTLYDFPGGRINEDEVGLDFTTVLHREIMEEIGPVEYSLNPSPKTALSWTWPNRKSMTFIYYLGKIQSGEIKISDEHHQYHWVNENQLLQTMDTYHKKAVENIFKKIDKKF